jgi:hypothetical protein
VNSLKVAPPPGVDHDGKPDPELVSTWPLFPVAPAKVKAVVKLADAITGEVKVTPDAIRLLVIAVSPILSPVIVADAILAPVIVLFARSAKVISPSAIMAEEITFDVILAAVIFESAIFLLFYWLFTLFS